jgi:hypothetical protein
MSLAQPRSTVAMPADSSARAVSDKVWWHTGQLGTSSAASTPSSRQRCSTSGMSTSIVWRWLRLVGMPWNRAARRKRPCCAHWRISGKGNQLRLSAIDVCLRSIATWAMRRSWSCAVSPAYGAKNFAAALYGAPGPCGPLSGW